MNTQQPHLGEFEFLEKMCIFGTSCGLSPSLRQKLAEARERIGKKQREQALLRAQEIEQEAMRTIEAFFKSREQAS